MSIVILIIFISYSSIDPSGLIRIAGKEVRCCIRSSLVLISSRYPIPTLYQNLTVKSIAVIWFDDNDLRRNIDKILRKILPTL